MRSGRIELGDVTPHNIKQLRKLNSVIFPVSYNDKFYKDVLEVGELAKLAFYNDTVVGAVCCRVDHVENTRRLYIMTLGCLAPYRKLGIGTVMLHHVLKICEKDGNFDNIYFEMVDHENHAPIKEMKFKYKGNTCVTPAIKEGMKTSDKLLERARATKLDSDWLLLIAKRKDVESEVL